MQTKDELATAYNEVRRLYARGTWRHGPPRPIGLRLTAMGGPDDVTLPALEAFIDYARAQLGLDFDLLGGGIGCFDLVLGADAGRAEDIENAIEQSPRFQMLLNDLNVNIVRLQMPAGTRTYAAHVRIKAGLVTNRSPNPAAEPSDPLAAFGCDLADELSFGILEFHVLDLESGRSKASLSRRIWHQVTLRLGDLRDKRFRVTVARLEIVEKGEFRSLVTKVEAKALLLSVHGYANGFATALESFSRFIYNTHLDRLAHFPILFSWPSSPNPLTYGRQTRDATNSRTPLTHTFQVLCDAAKGRPVNVVAHSHGNDILVSVVRDRANARTLPLLHRAVLVEPDVDQLYLSSELELISGAVKVITIYHSNNDLALAIAGSIFQATRAGAGGVAVRDALAASEAIEVIDASKVAVGLVKHAPHVDAPEVIYDIRDVLQNRSPYERSLDPGLSARLWQLRALR